MKTEQEIKKHISHLELRINFDRARHLPELHEQQLWNFRKEKEQLKALQFILTGMTTAGSLESNSSTQLPSETEILNFIQKLRKTLSDAVRTEAYHLAYDLKAWIDVLLWVVEKRLNELPPLVETEGE